ncbi:CocE/NonD family hydrolase [Sporosarcina trichiuri]|uniref:CocE/NonD family hydrolase n=1 Tax=Sporosarcina trichiuri TaxID=3056445 RepID=UPI0025B5B702|nr:CocE/NonD family hydrolase [Sporosarcina sp. 0.2-SM1T-5]WJY28379.1 CocE/NonD family hydrolase [Sporosarcina sp. 0.2-SM1T-5]
MVFNVRETNRTNRTEYPYKVKELSSVMIPLSDGTQLAAHIWLPEDAEQNPVPAVLEYLPYRKNDFTALRDSLRHPYFAGHGYASIRIDIRGTGDSDGILYDEYLKQEQDDALEVLDWIGKQPWSAGKVGMIGKSWGGFNGLQIAARQHPALKAIITLCSTDDRYADDVHYKGGAMLASDMLWWASTMFAYNARPQFPEARGESWRENWLERMELTPPYAEAWVRHQRRDAYWKHGSVIENYDDIEIPVYAVGGWADGYTNAIPRLLTGLKGPKKGLIGPWAHEYPEMAVPGPQIGFLQEAVRWWDEWLKEEETGIMDEPMLRVYMQDSVSPQTDYACRPGHWAAEEQWPPAAIKEKQFFLNGRELAGRAGGKDVIVSSVQQHGHYAGVFCPFGQPGDLPADQRIENGMAVVFDASPAEEDEAILGEPEFRCRITPDKKAAHLVVRLNDVAPDGSSTRVTWGVLNLTHRDSDEHPSYLEPGKAIDISVKMNVIGHTLQKGHHWQLAVSPNYWPHIWPFPEEVTFTLETSERTALVLPIREPKKLDRELKPFPQAETAPVLGKDILREAGRTREVKQDAATGIWVLDDFSDEGKRKLHINGIEYGSTNRNVYTIQENNPLSARVECDWTLSVGKGDWQTYLETKSTMSADESFYYLMNELKAWENGAEVFHKVWEEKIERDFT